MSQLEDSASKHMHHTQKDQATIRAPHNRLYQPYKYSMWDSVKTDTRLGTRPQNTFTIQVDT